MSFAALNSYYNGALGATAVALLLSDYVRTAAQNADDAGALNSGIGAPTHVRITNTHATQTVAIAWHATVVLGTGTFSSLIMGVSSLIVPIRVKTGGYLSIIASGANTPVSVEFGVEAHMR